MKKTLCILLAFFMLIPIIPVMAAGDVAENAANAYFKVGNEYYSTLRGAISDAANARDRTVYLLKDATVADRALSIPSGADVTLDLGGHTLTASDTTYYLVEYLNGKLTVKNGTLNVSRGIVVKRGGYLVFDGVNLTVTNRTAAARPAVKLSGQGTTRMTVLNSYLKTYGPGESLVLAEHGTDAFVELDGNTVLEYAGVIDDEAQNCGAIAVQQAWGTGVDSAAQSSNTDLVLNVGGDAKIVNTAPADEIEGRVASAIILSTRGDVTLNLSRGATIEIDRVGGASKSYHIHRVNHEGKLTVNDRGANWSATQRTLSEGSVYFNSLWSDGLQVVGWTDGERLIKMGTAFSDKNATEALTFTPVCIEKGTFDMIDGASIRTVIEERVIRFATAIPTELVELLGDKVSFGTVIAEGSTNPLRSGGEKNDFAAERFYSYKDGKTVYYTGLFIDNSIDDKTAYQNIYAAISYMTVKYYDGSEDTFYTEFDHNNVRSMRDVAERVYANRLRYKVVDHIREVLDGEITGPVLGDSILVSYCTDGSLYNGAFNSQVGWYAAGMGYIIKTADGKLIAVDGGNSSDASQFYMLLREYCDSNKVTVDYWILTHPHGDHVNCLTSMTSTSYIADNIDIKNLVYYFPSDYDASTSVYNSKMKNIANMYGANIITPRKGQVINAGAAKIEFLYVPTNYSSFTTANQLSLIFTVKTNKKVMFTGDAFADGLTAAYNEYGSQLKCDILQMPHHFLCDTGYKPFYEAADASEVILPTCISGYEAMYNDPDYKNSTKHKANDWAAQNADKVYKAFDGTVEIII